jgi:hypothetical protein
MARSVTISRLAALSRSARNQAGFTLVEIILAIGLATGLLLVALTFYHQAAGMRGQLLREADRITTMRLVLDRLVGDLRAAVPHAGVGNEFTGDANSFVFIKLACTDLASDNRSSAREPTDLVRVSLTTLFITNGNSVVVSALDRSETPLALAAPALLPIAESDVFDDVLPESSNPVNVVKEPFADMVRFVRLRYWDGAVWQPGWTNAAPPPGVEIVLSSEANADDAEPDALPPEALRRVVFVPGGLKPSTTNVTTTDFAIR